jgi:hypothetical protein
MNLQTIAAGFLRVVGLLLIVLGLVHWAATPYIPPLLRESSSGVYQRAVGPTLLDHGLFGILLLLWARRVLRVNGVVVLTFPVSLAVFTRRPEYYTAPLFLTAVMLVAVISLLTLLAACLVGRGSATSAECLGSDQLR